MEAAAFETWLRHAAIGPGAGETDGGLKTLCEAMAYSLFAGGKRIRPVLTLTAGRLFAAADRVLLPVAAAFEMVHTYSLIHDDLPAMDDDNFRRGRPTNHRVHGEGMAILAGDALLTDAFRLLAGVSGLDADVRCRLVALLAGAAGSQGMVGGQAMDLFHEGSEAVDADVLWRLQALKTGAMLTGAVVAGGLAGGAGEEELAALEDYGRAIGRAFQVADDILDETGTLAELGKDIGSDRERGKVTAVSLLGLDAARKLLAETVEKACAVLAVFGSRAVLLQGIARYIATRRS
ncbi:MAG: polyprenyl synthetase family protein [Deltaproteobacteria bacterium]|nr:polyprenyl synthetase family protein [Candidatus Anaeroferrophillacea bacterium]